MSHKTIASVLMLIAAALGGPVAVDYTLDVQGTVESSVTITGPETADVGELVTLKVSGSRPSWLTPTGDAKVTEGECYISFRSTGTYEVIATAIAGGKTSIVRHVIVVGVPEPVNPPTPPAPAPPVPAASDLAADVAAWCVDADAPKTVCLELGNNFIKAATDANTITELLNIVSDLNRKTNQKGAEAVLARVQRHIFQEVQGKDFTAHQCAFSEIGDGLINYSKGL